MYLPAKFYSPPDKIKLVDSRWDVLPLLYALEANPSLWNQNTGRTAPVDSPHHGIDDIWCRFAETVEAFVSPHVSQWWPASDVLPIRSMARKVMAMTGAEQLGGILITRVPAGKEVLPHTDLGWHARYYDKIAVSLQSHPKQVYGFDGQGLETKPGDVFWFDNSQTHWVKNPTPFDRVTAIFCVRIDRSDKA